jgi:hypothetical protein
MNPSSLSKDVSAVQRQKDMNRNRLGDELGETNKLYGSELTKDEVPFDTLKVFTDPVKLNS